MVFTVLVALFLYISVLQGTAAPSDETEFLERRMTMVKNQIMERGVRDPSVLRSMMSVPRHKFVPARYIPAAYDDNPLPIGHGQTISQPYIVAYMTEILTLNKKSKVLEVGTGSGYQAAVLSPIVGHVYTIEIIPELATSAALRLKELGYHNVTVATGDGYYGWSQHAPYDAIIVTAAGGHIPPPLLGQLKNNGSMVIPVGGAFLIQNLVLLNKDKYGSVTTRNLMPVRFVPLTGRHD
ncbi:MAG: protein-L-isoaspartate(D-aspartate) O-methyltransferase [Deltaproteobacteria bacterium]|nr:protein-L-isoaspartate(D-aspartate) O-methyltransferase [Deltaproteobacteria bacterium]